MLATVCERLVLRVGRGPLARACTRSRLPSTARSALYVRPFHNIKTSLNPKHYTSSGYSVALRTTSSIQGASASVNIKTCAAVVAGAAAAAFTFLRTRSSEVECTAENDSDSEADQLTDDEQRVIELFNTASKSVVYVTNSVALRGHGLFGGGTTVMQSSGGSGWVWDDEGHIITNCHVIQQASNIMITTADHDTFECKVIGKDEARDVAVLKVVGADMKDVKPLPIAKSRSLNVGQKALAIGNPFGLDFTLTTGVVSALGRELVISPDRRPLKNMIQTDAAMNPGSSGGPLLNSRGKVIGMNTVIYSQSGSSAGVGFAIPSDTLKAVVHQLIKHGHPAIPGIGVTLAPDQLAKRFGIKGAVIMTTETEASQGEFKETYRDRRGNLHLGDIITRINSVPIKESTDVFRAFDDIAVGDWVEVEYDRLTGRRRGRAMEVENHTVKLQAQNIMAAVQHNSHL